MGLHAKGWCRLDFAVILMFFKEWLFVTAILYTAALCGIGALVPFGRDLPFLYLAGPLAGVLLIPFGANFFYAALGISYGMSAAFSATCCLVLPLASGRKLADL